MVIAGVGSTGALWQYCHSVERADGPAWPWQHCHNAPQGPLPYQDFGNTPLERLSLLARPLAMLLSLVPVVAGGTLASAQAPALVLRPGLVIKRPVRLVPNAYRLRASASLDSPLVVVRGDDVTVDFAGATLLGTADGSLPDEARGLAILVDGGRNVTIRRARIRGYKVAIRARGTHGLRIVDSDLSRNWTPRLYSVVEHESQVYLRPFHHNQHNEVLRCVAA